MIQIRSKHGFKTTERSDIKKIKRICKRRLWNVNSEAVRTYVIIQPIYGVPRRVPAGMLKRSLRLMGSRNPPAEETPTTQPCTLLVYSFSRNRKLFKIYKFMSDIKFRVFPINGMSPD